MSAPLVACPSYVDSPTLYVTERASADAPVD